MDNLKLRPYDGIALAAFLTLPGLFFTAPAMIIEHSAGASWMSVLLGHLAVLCVFLLVTVLLGRYPGKDILAAAGAVLGRGVGIFYSLLLAVYFCIYTGLWVREGAEILKTYGMSLTPLYVVVGLIALSAFTMNFFGGKAIAKSAGTFFVLILAGIAFILILGLNRYNPDYIFPLYGNGASSIGRSALISAGMVEGVLVLALFAPNFESTAKLRKSGALAIGISGILWVLFFLCLVMMFSSTIASGMVSGFMEMGKSIYYNRFFYRFESFLLFFLIFSLALTACIGLYAARKSAGVAFGRVQPKILTVACTGIVFVVALIPANLFDLTSRYFAITRRYSIVFVLGVPLLLLAISLLRGSPKHEK
ncbi:MAG: spore germination protein [Oscillospiraceae bacterium]|nr:spore germination protein [Oscillospiraceae bacterium]